MSLMDYIRQFIEKGGEIKKIPLGQSGLQDKPVPMFWVEEDNVIRVNFQ